MKPPSPITLAPENQGEPVPDVSSAYLCLQTPLFRESPPIRLCTPDDEPAFASRATRQLFEDHLRLRAAGELEEDLRRNYAPEVALLTENSVLRGHEALRISASRLKEQLPNARFEFTARQVSGDYAFLIWQAESDLFRVECGADSFIIRNGKIWMQTVHCRLVR